MSLQRTRGKQALFFVKWIHRFFCIILFSSLATRTASQCEHAFQQVIPDAGVLSIDLLVSGLVNSDLSSPTQGICAVEIDFMHEYLGDLTISLISPSGTRVDLVGPSTTATTPTNLSMWEITFLPCMSPSAPDVGFAGVWSNLQAWQILTNYSGSYHPQSGCLENFNTGSANGNWQVIVEDHNGLQTGVINRISIQFCDPAGLQCMQCDPNAGTIGPASLDLCVGDNISSGDLTVDFGGNPPPSGLYNYSFLMSSGNTIIRSGFSFSENPLPGVYTICGLSYLDSDTTAVNALLAGADLNALNLAITNGTICAALSSPCMTVNVAGVADTVFVQEHLCQGESFTYRGETFANAGTFIQTQAGPGACDSVFRIDITKSNLQVIIDPPGILSCGSSNATLTSHVIGNTGMVTYAWTTHLGNIVGATNTPIINIDQPGQYLLTVSDMGCVATTSVSVMADSGFPQIFVSGGTITCTNTTVDLFPVYIPTSSSILWTGPFGFTTNVDSITVSVPGTYFIRATNAQGCTSVRSVEVKIDTATHNVGIVELNRDCPAGTATLSISIYDNVTQWHWLGPNGFESFEQRPAITDPGVYTLTNTFLNGCTRFNSIAFDGDFSIPDLTGPMSDTLNCNEIIPLSLTSSVFGVSYTWFGPNGFASTSPIINVSTSGTFLGTVYSPNGCIAEHAVEIFQGNDIFSFSSFNDTITCRDDTITIGVIAPVADEFHWINHTGPDSLLSSIMVGDPGIYTVIMTDTNSGCSVLTNILVVEDVAIPGFLYRTDTITCADADATLSFVPFPGYIYEEIFWILPDQTIVPGQTITSGDPGVHQLHGVSPNGCASVWNILIPFDTFPPLFFLEPEELGCDKAAIINSITFDPLSQILWTGPGGFTSTGFNTVVPDTGIYVATAFGTNGCSASVSTIVESNFLLPDLSVEWDTLDCLSPTAALTAHSFEAASFEWTDPAGTVIGNDSIVLVSEPGDYIIHAIGSNHCITADTITLTSPYLPEVHILADTFICGIDSMTIIAESEEPNPDFVWISITGDTLGFMEELEVYDSGPYVVAVTGVNGCEGRDTLTIPVNQVTPSAVIEMIGELRCQDRDFMLDGSGSSPANVNFTWITVGGMILSDDTAPTINASDTGLYVLIVENPNNGCTNIASVKVDEHPDAITGSSLDITPQACSGDSNAAITVTSVEGGIPGFLYQLGGTVPQTSPTFQGLSSGSYLLEIMDEAGCIYDTTIILTATLPYNVDAGPDVEIHIGETVDLNGTSNIDPTAIFAQTWDSLGIVLCNDCPSSLAGPFSTTTYTYTIASQTGCIISDEMTVFVIEKGKFFIPNVFTPNGDAINDEIRFHGAPGVRRVLQWIIFDRWGDAVFGKTDFLPDDPFVFWDGTAPDNQPLNPAVFPYMVQIELLNGNIETHHGSITLIR